MSCTGRALKSKKIAENNFRTEGRLDLKKENHPENPKNARNKQMKRTREDEYEWMTKELG